MSFYRKHVFFCLNQRDNGKQCCMDNNAADMLLYAKNRLRELGLLGAGEIRINKAGCLGRCAQGPSIVVYPDGVWYSYRNQADIDRIIDEHLLNDRVVNDLLMPESQK